MLAKPRFLRLRDATCRTKIEVPLEFQGLGSLGAASWRWFFPCEFDSNNKERAVAAEDPSVSGVSGRYATALFELARDEKSIDAVKADLDKFDAMLVESADLKRLVRSPVFSADTQLKALTAVLDKAGISGISANFLKVLTANRRLFAVGDVIRAFRALVAKFKGEATADVTVAETLSDKNLDVLTTAPRKFPRSSRTRSRISARRLRFRKSDRCCPSVTVSPASTASTTSRPARWSSSRTAPAAWRSTWRPTTSAS